MSGYDKEEDKESNQDINYDANRDPGGPYSSKMNSLKKKDKSN